jgi:hypothetical protein
VSIEGRVDLRIGGRPAVLVAEGSDLQLRTRSPRALLQLAACRSHRRAAQRMFEIFGAELQLRFLGLPLARLGE